MTASLVLQLSPSPVQEVSNRCWLVYSGDRERGSSADPQGRRLLGQVHCGADQERQNESETSNGPCPHTHTHTDCDTCTQCVSPVCVVRRWWVLQTVQRNWCLHSVIDGLLVFVLYHNIEWLSESGCSCVSVPFHMLDTAFDSLEKPCL